MELISRLDWHPDLFDPTGKRTFKPRKTGLSMVIDKGVGLQAFRDLLCTSGEYIDLIKIGFGSAVLYPRETLQQKISLAREHDICILPGGTFLEMAVHKKQVDAFFEMVRVFGFDGMEVSDGTIDLSREMRDDLILRGKDAGLNVFTEYGKKLKGRLTGTDSLIETVERDLQTGARLVTIEGRESGKDVGLYDENGVCQDELLENIVRQVSAPERLMWETPLKAQQVYFIKTLGANANLGNIAPHDIMSLESLRRGLRSDTFFAVT